LFFEFFRHTGKEPLATQLKLMHCSYALSDCLKAFSCGNLKGSKEPQLPWLEKKHPAEKSLLLAMTF